MPGSGPPPPSHHHLSASSLLPQLAQGFVRLALQQGASLVPVLALGEARQFKDMFNAPLWQKVRGEGEVGYLIRGSEGEPGDPLPLTHPAFHPLCCCADVLQAVWLPCALLRDWAVGLHPFPLEGTAALCAGGAHRAAFINKGTIGR